MGIKPAREGNGKGKPVHLGSTGSQGPFCLCLCVLRTREDMGSMELEPQAVVSCPLWVLGTVAGPLGEQQGSSPLSHLSGPSAVC